jgi:hypothetical protein
MSSGHAKVQVLPAISKRLYEKALRDPAFQAALKKRYTVSHEYPIPYLAGYSKDGKTLYIDKRFHLTKLEPYLLIHEHWEKTAIDLWHLSYWYAHGLATYAEHQAVIHELHQRPVAYERKLAPAIHEDEREDEKGMPPDIDMTPYKAPDHPPSATSNPFTR